MPFNGSGLFVRAYNWVQDKVNGINITASRMDGDSDGFAAGLSNCVTRDGQGKMTSNFNPGADATYDIGGPSARWRNIGASGTISSNDSLQNSGRVIKNAPQSVTNSATPVADTQLVINNPILTGSYIIEARVAITANANAAAGGLKLGLYALNINFNEGLVTGWGNIGGNIVIPGVVPMGTVPTGTTSYAFSTLNSSGVAGNWFQMSATINIVNITNTPFPIGVCFGQNVATSGGTVTIEAGSYINLIRVT